MTTIEKPLELDSGTETYSTSHEVAAAVLDRVERLANPETEEYGLFYGKPGIVTSELVDANRASGGHTVLLKDETKHFIMLPDGNTTLVETFKRRGARAATIFALQQTPGLTKLATASAGGHGQGVAAAALEFGLECEVHTRGDASPVKLKNTRQLGAKVYDIHDTLPEALTAASQVADAAFIHPFANVETIAGPATIGLEMLDGLYKRAQNGELNLFHEPIDIILPEGGGGLATGVAVIIKDAKDKGLIGDNVRVIVASVENKTTNTWCDGTATETGELPSLVLNDAAYVQARVTVTNLEVANAMYELTGIYKKRIEPAGAVAYAAAQQLNQNTPTRDGYTKRTAVVPVTGANVSVESFNAATMLRRAAYEENLRALGKLVSHSFAPVAPQVGITRTLHVADGLAASKNRS